VRSRFWTSNITLVLATVFFASVGQGLWMGVTTNFFVEDLGLSGQRIMWLAGIREIPGLLLIFLAAPAMRLPLSRRTSVSLLLMGLGFGSYGLARSYLGLIAAVLVGSVGFHNWFALQGALGMSLVGRERSGYIMGRIRGMRSLASLLGMVLVILLAAQLGLRWFFLIAGVALVIGALLVLRVPTSVGASEAEAPRLVFKRRYWLYYVLWFFDGARTQVFHALGSWVLVYFHQVTAAQLAILNIVTLGVNSLTGPWVGDWIDRFGERKVLTASYVALAAGYVGYATARSVWLLAAMFVVIRFLILIRVGLDTYANRIVPPGELAQTLTAGVSVNHITSVGVSLIAGQLMSSLGYQTLCYAAAVIILISCPFSLSMKSDPEGTAA
jgi:predicted MFS family arabinose efflux permease